jgi:hypothetical protein
MVAAAIRTVFAQPDAEHVRSQLDVIATMLGRQFPAVETMLRDAREELLAFTDFPVAHWKKVWSTNPLERLNKEVKRRTDVVGCSPTPPRCSAWPAPSWSKPTTNGRSGPPLPVRRLHGPTHPADQAAEEVAQPALIAS